MRIYNLFYVVVGILFLTSCVHQPEMTILSDQYNNKKKTFVELSESGFTPDLRIALSKRDYKLLKFKSQRKVAKSVNSKEMEIYNESAADFALETHFTSYYKCNFSDAYRVHLDAEVVNISTNEVVAVISVTGWTGNCPLTTNEQVFDKLIDYLDELNQKSK